MAKSMIPSIPEHRFHRSKGFALILVIWALVIMLGVSAGFAMSVRHEARVATDAVTSVENEAIATAARNLALIALYRSDEELRWRADGLVREIAWPGVEISVRLRSDSSRIDLNQAPRDVLVGLLEQVAPERDADALADAVADWRDRDDRRSANGAEADDYRTAGLAYAPGNQAFRSVHELSQVLGFDANLTRSLVPYITIYGRHPRINALGAESIVLAAVPGIDPVTAEQFVETRRQVVLEGLPPQVDSLGEGRRYIDIQQDARVLLMDLAIRRKSGPIHLEQLVMERDGEQSYRLLARSRLSPNDIEPWWQP
jgi:general secretion pathway protein K